MSLWLEMFLYISLSGNVVLGPRPSSSPGVPAKSADSQAPPPHVLHQNHSGWGPGNLLFRLWDYAQRSLRTPSLRPLPICIWNSSPLIAWAWKKWLEHGKNDSGMERTLGPNLEVGKSESPEMWFLYCISHRCHFQNTASEKLIPP